MGLGFILGVLAGFIGVKLYDIAYDWYTWHTYKDNIDWDYNECCGDSEYHHGE